MSAIAANLLLGTLASIIAGIALLVITNKDDLRYYLVARRRYRALEGRWVHYRLTRARGSAESLWVGSVVDLRLSRFGRLSGELEPALPSLPSEQNHGNVRERRSVDFKPPPASPGQPAVPALPPASASEGEGDQARPATADPPGVELERSSYAASGVIRNGIMRLRLDNASTQQEPITMTFPDLQSRQLLGVWLGQDMDQRWTTSPSVLSKDVLTPDALDGIALRQRVLSRVTTRHFVRFFPGEESSRWWTEIGTRVVEHADADDKCPRCVVAGEAREDGTDKLIFGPYERLPLVGTYKVTWRLAVRCPDTVSHDAEVVRLDVYGRDHALKERRLKCEDVSDQYARYSLEFPYTNPRMSLEYRVSLLKRGVAARLYDVTVERPGVNDD